MCGKFIYVFDIEQKNELINQGFILLKEDIEENIYIFENDINKFLNFEDKSKFMVTNSLCF